MRYVASLILISATVSAQFGTLAPGPDARSSQGALPQAASVGFHPWLSAHGNYTRGIEDTSSSGLKRDLFFPSFSGGVGGWKSWENRQFAGNYTGFGSYRDSSSTLTPRRWVQSHIATLDYSQQLNQRFSVNVTEAGGATYGGFGSGAGFGSTGIGGLSSSFGPGSLAAGIIGSGIDLSQNGIVDNEFLPSRVIFSLTSGGLKYMIDQRTAVSFSGVAALVRRDIRNGNQRVFSGAARLTHQFSSRLHAQGSYERMQIDYVSIFGGVSGDSVWGALQFDIDPRTTFAARAGGGLMNSTFTGAVPIAPEIAAILGSGTVLEVRNARFLTPLYDATLRRRFQAGSFVLTGSRGFTPGNGALYAGVRDSATAHFSQAFGSRVGVNWMASYHRTSGRIGTYAVHRTVQGGALISFRFIRSLNFTMQGGARTLHSSTGFDRKELLASAGLAWSPGSLPFVF